MYMNKYYMNFLYSRMNNNRYIMQHIAAPESRMTGSPAFFIITPNITRHIILDEKIDMTDVQIGIIILSKGDGSILSLW